MRARFSQWLLVLVWVSLLSGCVDPIDLEVGQEEKRLVVDGLITDEEGPYTVRLTYTAAFQQGIEGLTENVKGVRVRIEDDTGEVALLHEEAPHRARLPARAGGPQLHAAHRDGGRRTLPLAPGADAARSFH